MLSHFSRVWLCATLWTIACQASLSMGFSRQEYWSGLPCPPPGDCPDPGIEPMFLGLLHYSWILYCWATGESRHGYIDLCMTYLSILCAYIYIYNINNTELREYNCWVCALPDHLICISLSGGHKSHHTNSDVEEILCFSLSITQGNICLQAFALSSWQKI